MHKVQEANEENAGSCPADPVLVVQAMGRKIGFIPAAARLADPDREMPLLIYLAESPCSLAELAETVSDRLRRCGRCLVVISEGFNVGDLGEMKDAFGHIEFGSSQTTVAQTVVNYLNRAGLPCKGAARANVMGTDQRHSMAYASTVDLDEAYRLGQKAVELAAAGQSGFMATILRQPGPSYSVRYDKVPLVDVADSQRTFPRQWIASGGCDVTDDFVRYAKPLVGSDMLRLPIVDGRQRMTRFAPIYAARKLPLTYLKLIANSDGPPAQARLPGRNRFGRLRVRYDGTEAQGMLHSQHDQLLGVAGRQQVCPRGRRVRQPLLEEPRHQPFSGLGRDP